MSKFSNLETTGYDDSNDSSLYGGKDVSFNEKDLSMSLAERRLRQRSTQQQHITNQKPNENIYLQQCLDHIHRLLSRKDKDDFFQFPVTDLIAPGYSSIIKKPMDFSTMKKKIDNFGYNNIMEYRDDFVLMCENAMTYNKSDTIYYHAARKLLDSGLKILNKDRLLTLRRSLPVMKNLTSLELGFVPEGEAEASYDHQIMIQRKKQAQKHHHHHHNNQHQQQSNTPHSVASKSNILQKLEIIKSEIKETPESILADTQAAAKSVAQKLALKFPNSKLGYLRRNSNGTTSMNFLNQDDNTIDKQLTVGNLCEALDSGSYSLNSFIEEKKNKAKPMYYLEYGPFSSHAPTYDSSFSNLNKEESDLLMTTYGDENAYQYALSLMEFAKGTGPLFTKYIDHVLNSLTNNDHQKYVDSKRAKLDTASTTNTDLNTQQQVEKMSSDKSENAPSQQQQSNLEFTKTTSVDNSNLIN